MPTLNILQGDWCERLREIPDKSVELVLTSPPYDQLRHYEGFKWEFEAGADQLFRVLVSGGLVCWNVADQTVDGGETLTSFRQALYFVDQVGFRMHDTMIYNRLNFSAPETVRYHEP